MRKPEVGDYYKLPLRYGYNIIKVLAIRKGGEAECMLLSDTISRTWYYEIHPEGLDYKLTSLEIELL